MKTSEIENLYKHWYADEGSGEFEKIQSGWRHLGALYKAKNISRSFRPVPPSQILDIGGGMGEVSEVLFKEYSFPPAKLVEISKEAVDLANKKDGVEQALEFDGYTIPFPDRSVDFGFSTHVLEHVPEPRRFLREVNRVCKKVFIEVPIDYSDNIPTKHLLSFGHVNVFTPSTARFLLESEGFKIEQEFPSFTQRRYDMSFYNHFYNMSNPCNFVSKSIFNFRYLASWSKRLLKNTLPSEYCFLVTPDDDFHITSFVETQRKYAKS
jgi:ubiquinone/menaquinone biosynthesis C-methylase UbiE